MEKNEKTTVNLMYRFERYRAQGNGAMCQALMNEMNRANNASRVARSN